MIVKYTRSQLETLSKPKLVEIILQQQDSLIQLEKSLTQLKARVQQLEGQRHKDSHNSHIPSSRSKPLLIKNLRTPSSRPSGGQPGHPGHTLQMVDQPTATVTYPVTRCQHCGRDLSQVPAQSYERRQVFDLPPLTLQVSEYRAEKKLCPCGQMSWAHFPEAVPTPVQYGPHLQTLISVLLNQGYLSLQRVSETLEYLTGYPVSEATINSIQEKLYHQLAGFEARSQQCLIHSPLFHNDETGVSVEGQRRWAHVTSTKELTHYAIDPKRGREALERIGIWPHFQGQTLHDHWAAYFSYPQCRHRCCNIHHLRELTFLAEEEQAAWAASLKAHLLYGKALVEQAQKAGCDHLAWEVIQDATGRLWKKLWSRCRPRSRPVGVAE